MKYLLALFLYLGFIVFDMSAQTPKTSGRYSAFIETFRKESNDAGVVGSSFVFLKNNEVVAEEHRGLANLERSRP